jgi:hypothetical protein
MPITRQLPTRNERNFDTHPYTLDELRVVAWIQKRAPDIGGGDDPIGFLLSSYELLHMEFTGLRKRLEAK